MIKENVKSLYGQHEQLKRNVKNIVRGETLYKHLIILRPRCPKLDLQRSSRSEAHFLRSSTPKLCSKTSGIIGQTLSWMTVFSQYIELSHRCVAATESGSGSYGCHPSTDRFTSHSLGSLYSVCGWPKRSLNNHNKSWFSRTNLCGQKLESKRIAYKCLIFPLSNLP